MVTRESSAVFERFTDRARHVVVLAEEQARDLNHGYVGSEHALLGLLADREGVAAQALHSVDVTLDAARGKVVDLVGRGDRTPSGHIPFTPQAKRILEGGLREALQLGHNYIGTEHLLLALAREPESTGARTLVELGAPLDVIRDRVVALLAGSLANASATFVPGAPAPALAARGAVCTFCGRDLWEVDRYVTGATGAICAECVALADRALTDAPAGERAVTLPPRVFGGSPDEHAVDGIVEAVMTVLSDDVDDRQRAAAIEEGDVFAPLFAQVRRRHAGVDVEHRVERVRFVGHDRAEVRIAVGLGGPGAGTMLFEGVVVRSAGRWRMGHELCAAILRAGGVRVTPS